MDSLGFTYRITTVWNQATSILALFGRWASDSASLCRNIHRYICCYGVVAEGKYKLGDTIRVGTVYGKVMRYGLEHYDQNE
jgi:hypothetical protein